MASHNEEDDQLRAVALQNAQSILLARRRAEDELRKQSEWLRITLASIGDAVISTDAEGHVTFMNVVAEALTGWSQADALGRPLVDVFRIVHERTRQPVENPALEALRARTVVRLANHTILISRDGREVLIDDSAGPIRDDSGSTVGAILVFRDVSERKDTELARAHLAAIIESSEDAIVSKTLEGIILSWNAGAERLFGYPSEEAIGRPITLVIPADRLDEEHEIVARIARGERIEHFETVRVAKDGRRIEISLTVSPIRDADGVVIGASKIARDITDRRNAERALREVDTQKDRFIALLAHELRNPLAPLTNALQVMRLAADDASAVAGARDVMERQLSHLVRLIDDLLDISRIGQNKLELRRSRVLLADVVRSAVETARPLMDGAGHLLTVSLPAEPIHLDADLTRLSQVFGNLLTNSAKYTERGGRIVLAADRQGNDVLVSVRDNGIGIPADARLRIFDMFSQLDRRVERTRGGLGIGLALVKGLVEMHGGTVTAESEGSGKGSTFTVKLPAIATPSGTSAGGSSESAPRANGPRRRILVVDDNRDAADSMASMLELMGNEVRTAYSGAEALRTAEAFQPKLIFMDVGMPDLNGYDTTQRIREQSWGRGMVIIALTGWGQERDRVRSRDAGCDGHLVKPVNVLELEQSLRQAEESGRN
ncbi:MAG TPA: PAS domain S-box protein [Vicinamibacterales bacterium]|nr:PAS domain S-box protein [Vicinamibacterales bacterium]